jgi:hypothetical protein
MASVLTAEDALPIVATMTPLMHCSAARRTRLSSHQRLTQKRSQSVSQKLELRIKPKIDASFLNEISGRAVHLFLLLIPKQVVYPLKDELIAPPVVE